MRRSHEDLARAVLQCFIVSRSPEFPFESAPPLTAVTRECMGSRFFAVPTNLDAAPVFGELLYEISLFPHPPICSTAETRSVASHSRQGSAVTFVAFVKKKLLAFFCCRSYSEEMFLAPVTAFTEFPLGYCDLMCRWDCAVFYF